jgi:hypothetical protein
MSDDMMRGLTAAMTRHRCAHVPDEPLGNALAIASRETGVGADTSERAAAASTRLAVQKTVR